MTQEQIVTLLERYRIGQCTPEEEAAIIQWADEHGNKLPVETDQLEKKAFFQKLDTAITARTGIPLGDNTSTTRRITRYTTLRWIAAASVLLMIIAGSYYFTRQQHDVTRDANKMTATPVPIVPGSDKAILVLSDGTRINLDSIANGQVAMQGNVHIIKSGDGQLSYNSTGQNKVVQQVSYNTMQTPKGGQFQLVLPDQTKVWLNAASSITYPTVFAGNERNVRIKGEVYFEVARDKNKPFHVEVNDMRIEVLGTHFNVNAYDDEAAITTTLLEGSVKIKKGADSKILIPGQQAIVDHQINIRPADIEATMAWQRGLFQFNDADLQTVMRQLARWYDIQVIYENSIPRKTFIGKLPRDASVDQVLRALARTQVHFRIEGRQIIVTP